MPSRTLSPLLLSVLVATVAAAPARADGDGTAAAAPAANVAPPPADDRSRWAADPSDVVLGLRVQDRLLGEGRREEALSLFRKNRAARPAGDPVAAFLLGRIEGGTAGLRAMWDALEAGLGLPAGATGPLGEAWRALALAEESAGRFDRAALAARLRSDVQPTSEAFALAARLAERAGEADAAEAAYRRAVDLDPKAEAARDALTLLLARRGRHAEAKKMAAAAVKRSPDSADAYVTLGLVRFLSGDRRGAVEAYQQALDRAKDDPKVLEALASTYAAMEEFDLAKQALERARGLGPETAERLVQGAAVALQAGNVPEAQRLLARAEKLTPKDSKIAFLEGVCWQRGERVDAAVAAFRRAVSLEPRNASYALALAVALQESGKADAAISVLEDAVEKNPEHYGLQLRLGFASMERKRWTRAVQALERAAEIDPTAADPHFYAAVVYGDRMGREVDALEHLRAYKRLGGKKAAALSWLDELEKDAK
jgi:tetratricopeptide (TPR) repeat protein